MFRRYALITRMVAMLQTLLMQCGEGTLTHMVPHNRLESEDEESLIGQTT
jgi:hypothetical protein